MNTRIIIIIIIITWLWPGCSWLVSSWRSRRQGTHRLVSFRRETPRWNFPRSLAKRQGALLGCDSHLSVSRLIHFSCCSWWRGGSRTRCIPQRIEIRGVRWSLRVCSHCLRELGSIQSASARQLLSDLGRRLTDIPEKAAKPVTCFYY